MLHADAGQLDSVRFERLLAEGRAQLAGGDAATAAATLRDALSLWRGSPLGDLATLEFAQSDARRLEELRVVGLMDRIEAELELGAAHQLVPELESLVAQNPLQERLRGLLMLALYRCGRQADALAVYRETRQFLREELGLEPGRRLAGARARDPPPGRRARARCRRRRAPSWSARSRASLRSPPATLPTTSGASGWSTR